MSHFHETMKCSCGITISRCLCPAPDKKVRVVPNGCAKCKKLLKEGTDKLSAILDERYLIIEAIKEYHQALADRKHGDVASHQCLDKIQDILDMHWRD